MNRRQRALHRWAWMLIVPLLIALLSYALIAKRPSLQPADAALFQESR